MVAETRRLRRRFAPTAVMPWDAVTAAAELAVQLGHLALCLARRRGVNVTGFEDPDRPITDPGDELADVALAALSVAVLADTPPSPAPAVDQIGARADGGDDETASLLVMLVAAGQLAEAAMVACGYRHRPTGQLPPVADACATAVAAADRLADQLDLNLPEVFDAMTADAHRFLDQPGAESATPAGEAHR
ncbi:MAG: hypothetical protein GEV03_24570 [Streptosporangiales bacterium]|nr:hypothetical protein [Streptosporangiales bacterium]